MAYGQKYLFKWDSIYGVEYRIVVSQDGYSGTVIQRPLGGNPILKMQQNDCVKGTSLEWKAECRIDGEFADLYTSSPREFSVDLYRGSVKIWSGFITPELYSEPDIAPPYDVDLVATDGLGSLDLYDYERMGRASLRSILQTILAKTGQDKEIYFISQLHTGNVNDINFLRLMEMDLDFRAGTSCYEVLQELLRTLHATITLYRDKWLIVRENDYQVTGRNARAIAAGTRAQSNETTITDAVHTLGQLGVADMWPVGYSSTRIVPAKKRVTVEAPWHVVNALVNSDFSDGTTGWILPVSEMGEQSSLDASIPAVLMGPTYVPAPGLLWGNFLPTSIVQEVTFADNPGPVLLEASVSGYYNESSSQYARRSVEVRILYTDVNDNVYYLEPSGGDSGLDWVTAETNGRALTHDITSGTEKIEEADKISIQIPAFKYSTRGKLRIEFYGRGAYLFGASLKATMNKGYRDVVNIENGARGDDDTVEILIGRETTDLLGSLPFLGGILLYNNGLVSTVTDAHFTGDWLQVISRGRALSVALPRLHTSGHFTIQPDKTYAPLLVVHKSLNFAVETYNWDLVEEELDLEAISLPVAVLEVESEEVESLGDAEIINNSTSSSSSSGGSGSVDRVKVNGNTYGPDAQGVVTLPNYPTSLANPQYLNFVTTSSSVVKEYNGSREVDITASDLIGVLGFTPASQSAINSLSGLIQDAQGDISDMKDELDDHEDRITAIEQSGGGSGSVVEWGTQSTQSHTINLSVNGVTKTLVQKAGYDDLDDRVTTLENGGGGGGVGSIRVRNASGQDGTYTPVSGVVTLPDYPRSLPNPQYLNFARTASSAVIKEYNGSSEVTFTAADLIALLGYTPVDEDDLEDTLENYVDLDSGQVITGFKRFTTGIGLSSTASANSGPRIKVVTETISGVTKTRIHIYGDVVIHGEATSGDSSNNND